MGYTPFRTLKRFNKVLCTERTEEECGGIHFGCRCPAFSALSTIVWKVFDVKALSFLSHAVDPNGWGG